MIGESVQRAYKQFREKKYDKIYWAIDLHGVCFKSNYENGKYEWINNEALETLQLIKSFPESVIILWSSCHEEEKFNIIAFFEKNNIEVDYFNCNLEIDNTKTGCFDEKFYFSILLDDKAGFNPETDWNNIYCELIKQNEEK